jgi:hypothetical protein
MRQGTWVNTSQKRECASFSLTEMTPILMTFVAIHAVSIAVMLAFVALETMPPRKNGRTPRGQR